MKNNRAAEGRVSMAWGFMVRNRAENGKVILPMINSDIVNRG